MTKAFDDIINKLFTDLILLGQRLGYVNLKPRRIILAKGRASTIASILSGPCPDPCETGLAEYGAMCRDCDEPRARAIYAVHVKPLEDAGVALKELVEVKCLKDAGGKNSAYRKRRDIAWRKAKRILARLPQWSNQQEEV